MAGLNHGLPPILRDATLRVAPQDEGVLCFNQTRLHPEEGAPAPVAKDGREHNRST